MRPAAGPLFSPAEFFLRRTRAAPTYPSIPKLQHGKAPAASVTRRIMPAFRSRKIRQQSSSKLSIRPGSSPPLDAPVHRHALPRPQAAACAPFCPPYAPNPLRMSLPVCLSFPAGPLAKDRPVTIAPFRLPSPRNKPPALRSRQRFQPEPHRSPGWRGRASRAPGFSIKHWFGSCCFWKAHFDALLLTFGIARQRPLAVSDCRKSEKLRSAFSPFNRSTDAL